MDKKELKIRDCCRDYALDIPNFNDEGETVTLYFNSMRNAENVKRIIEVDRSVPNHATVCDMQEVVRCSNCIHIWLHSSGYYHCSVMRKDYKGYELGYNYCSYGEKVRQL